MGPVGAIVGQEVGGVAGREGATKIAKAFGAGKNGQEIARNIGNGVGRLFGGAAGGFLSPFETGGVVGKGMKRGAPVPILAHAGEIVLPLNAKATKQQMKVIGRNIKHHTQVMKHRFA